MTEEITTTIEEQAEIENEFRDLMEEEAAETGVNEHIEDIVTAPAASTVQKVRKARLMGIQKFVSKEELSLVPTPEPSGIWKPVSHMEAIETVEKQIAERGWNIIDEQFGLVNDSKRMFGVLTVENSSNPEWRRCLGIRNSHDKSVRLGICAGLNVIVCSNLCFGGNKTVQRKHTTHIDVENVVEQALASLDESYEILERRMKEMKGIRINDDHARSILVQLAGLGAIPSCDILACYNEYKEPRHPEFESETQWDLFNAVTEISHKYSPARSERTHTFLTQAFGLDGNDPKIIVG